MEDGVDANSVYSDSLPDTVFKLFRCVTKRPLLDLIQTLPGLENGALQAGRSAGTGVMPQPP